MTTANAPHTTPRRMPLQVLLRDCLLPAELLPSPQSGDGLLEGQFAAITVPTAAGKALNLGLVFWLAMQEDEIERTLLGASHA